VGGGGGNAVAHMVTSGIEGVEFMCINTDAQALKHSKVKTSLQIGCNITKGLGAGADPEWAARRRWKIAIASSR
jgi:cell division protein FtsZ